MGESRLRVAQVSWRYGRHHEGISRAVTELSERLARRHEVHVFAAAFEGPAAPGLRFRPVRCPRQLGWLWSLGFAIQSGRAVSRERFDIVHLHVPSLTRADVVTCHLSPRTRLAWVSALRGQAASWLTARRKLRLAAFRALEPLYRYNIRDGRCRRVVAVSRKVRSELVAGLGLPESAVEVIPLGVDLERFHPLERERRRLEMRRRLGVAEDDFALLFVGHNFLGKGLPYCVSALAGLRDEPLRLIVVGAGDEGTERPLRAQVAREGLGGRVGFVGAQKDVAPFMAAADAFVLPSPDESFGLALLEAMASGLPVIATRGAGCLGTLEGAERAGVWIDDASNVGALREAIRSLRRSPATAAEMGRRGRGVAERYSWERHSEAVLELYGKLQAQERAGSTAPAARRASMAGRAGAHR